MNLTTFVLLDHHVEANLKHMFCEGYYACVIENDDTNRKDVISDEVVTISLTSKSRDAGSIGGGDVTIPFATRFTVEAPSNKLRPGSNVTVCVNANGLVLRSLQVGGKMSPLW